MSIREVWVRIQLDRIAVAIDEAFYYGDDESLAEFYQRQRELQAVLRQMSEDLYSA